MHRVCVITATRAEYGILQPLMYELKQSAAIALQLIVTGTHLSQLYGTTSNQIVDDGFEVDEYVTVLEEGDDVSALLQTMANVQQRIGAALARLMPDVVVVLGDRYELIPLVSTCAMMQIPVCHIHGGEITQGAVDDMFRHAITKMSHVHFASTKQYANRIIQLGEQPNKVFNVGSLGVEQVKKLPLYSKEELQREIGFAVDENTLLVTFHPVTMETQSQVHQMQALLDALALRPQYKVLFTRPNADLHRNDLNDLMEAYVVKHPHTSAIYSSLGQKKFLSAMKYCKAVVGNSSSGIIEAPSFGIPTINIGNRQKGRISAVSVLHCEANKAAILHALDELDHAEFLFAAKTCHNPYEGKDTANTIVKILTYLLDQGLTCLKPFYDIS